MKIKEKSETFYSKTYLQINPAKLILYFFVAVSIIVLLYSFSFVVPSIIVAALIAYVFEPFVSFFEKRGAPRSFVVFILSFFILILLVYLFNTVSDIIPTRNEMEKISIRLINILSAIRDYLNSKIEIFNWDLLYSEIIEKIFLNKNKILDDLINILIKFSQKISLIILVPFGAFFFLLHGRILKKSLLSLVPNRYFELTLVTIEEIDHIFGGYVRGTLFESFVMSIISTLGFYFIGFPFWIGLVSGIIVGITNAIPYLGPILGLFASIGVVLFDLIPTGFISIFPWKPSIISIVILIILVQTIDNIILKPVIIGKSVNLNPFLVVIAVIAGANSFGFLGLLLSVPFVATVKVLIYTLYKQLKGFGMLNDNLASIVTKKVVYDDKI